VAKLKEFVVTGTNIADEDGNKCKPGSKIMLSKKSAEHYHKLGYITIAMGDVFGEDDDTAEEAANTSGEDTQEAGVKSAPKRERRKPSSRATQAALNEASGGRSN